MSLRLLRDAVAHDSYFHERAITQSDQQVIRNSETIANYHEDGFRTLPSPESTTAALLREPFNSDSADPLDTPRRREAENPGRRSLILSWLFFEPVS